MAEHRPATGPPKGERAASARESVDHLAFALRQYGFTRLYVAHAGDISVLSVSSGLTVWCRHGLFRWRSGGGWTLRRADAPEATARHLIRTRTGPRQPQPGPP